MILLAKSRRRGDAVTLERHLADTEDAALAVFKLGGRPLRSWLRFFRLPPESADDFLLHLRVAALFHDIGKANSDFQAAVAGGAGPQMLRHEHLSALILHRPPVWNWLGHGGRLDRDVVAAAVLSHHLKARREDWAEARRQGRVSVFLDDPQVRATLRRVAEAAGLPPAPRLESPSWACGGESSWDAAWEAANDRADAVARCRDPKSRRLLLAVKAAVIVADAVSSALVREGHPISAWVDEALHGPPLHADGIEQHIIQGRLEEVARRTNRPAGLRPFQLRAAVQGPRTLLLAGCGAGKTLAAWNWAAAQASATDVGRVVFLYPTRGTATEGFKDYVGLAPDGG